MCGGGGGRRWGGPGGKWGLEGGYSSRGSIELVEQRVDVDSPRYVGEETATPCCWETVAKPIQRTMELNLFRFPLKGLRGR